VWRVPARHRWAGVDRVDFHSNFFLRGFNHRLVFDKEHRRAAEDGR